MTTADTQKADKGVIFAPTGPGTRLRLYSVTHDMLGDPFWAVYRRGLEDAANAVGCTVHHLAPEQFSPREMVAHLDRAVAAHPDGILATIPDAALVEAPLLRAIASGTPVIAVNAADPRAEGKRIPYLFYIGADDFCGGQTAGQRLLELAAPARALLIDHYTTDNACHVDRWRGFADVMQRAGIEPRRLRLAGERQQESKAAIAAAIDDDRITAVCTLGPPGAALANAAIAQSDARQLVVHGSFDLAPAQLDAIAAGELAFTIDSQQYLQGYLGITLLALHAEHGFTLTGDVLTGPVIVDATNAGQIREQAKRRLR
jgi:simple sugar transport system substrate-binding protein